MQSNITFTHLNLERYTHLRTDKNLQGIPLYNKKYIVFCNGKPVLRVDPSSFKLSVPFFTHQTLETQRTSVFLGKKEEHYLFAVDLYEIPLTIDTTNETIKAIDLRRAAISLHEEEASLLGYAQSLLYWNKNCIYCNRCAQKLIPTFSGDRRICDHCNIEFYPRINPVVIMLIHTPDRHSVLLGRQRQYPKGMYSCLAGFVEIGETLQDALCREVFEETGVLVQKESIEFIDHQPWPFPSQMMLGFIAQAQQTKIVLDDELEDARWFSTSDLQSMRSSQHKDGYTIPNSVAIATSLVDIFLSRFS